MVYSPVGGKGGRRPHNSPLPWLRRRVLESTIIDGCLSLQPARHLLTRSLCGATGRAVTLLFTSSQSTCVLREERGPGRSCRELLVVLFEFIQQAPNHS